MRKETKERKEGPIEIGRALYFEIPMLVEIVEDTVSRAQKGPQ